MNNSFAFCTITYGDKYISLGDEIINQLTSLGYTFYVLTTDVARYKNNKNVIAIQYNHPYFSFHQKRVIVRECLKSFDSAIFLDADVFLLNESIDLSNFSNALPGLHIFATFGNIGHTFLNSDINKCEKLEYRNTKYGERGRKILESLNLDYKKNYHNLNELDYLEHYLEGKWILKKDDGKELLFLDIWDSLVDICEKIDIELGFFNTIGAGEGAVMSIAAHNSNIKIYCGGNLTYSINTNFISNYREKCNGTKPWNIAG